MKIWIRKNFYALLGISLILILIGLLIHRHGLNVLYWGDSNLCFYESCFTQTLAKQFGYVWYDKASSGFPFVFQNFTFIPVLLQYPFYFLTGSISLSQYGFLFSVFFLSFFSAFSISRKFTDKGFLQFIVGIFYTFNPWILDRILMGHLGIWIGYAIFPIFLFLFYKLFIYNKNIFKGKDIFITSLLSSLLIFIYPQVAYFTVLSGSIMVIWGWKNTRIFYKKVVSFSLLCLALLAFFYFPLISYFSASDSSATFLNDFVISRRAEFELFKQQNNLFKAFLFSGTFIDYSLSILKIYPAFFFAFIGTIVYFLFTFLFRNNFSSKEGKQKIILFCLFLGLIFISKGAAGPFSAVNYFIFEYFPLFESLFRDANKFGFLSCVLFSLLLIFTFAKKILWYDKVILTIFASTLLIPVYSFLLTTEKGYGIQSFPLEKISFLSFLNEEKRTGKTLVYPGYTAEVKYPFLNFVALDFLSVNNSRYLINYNQKGLDIARSISSKNFENQIYESIDNNDYEFFNTAIEKENIDSIVYYSQIELGKGNYFFTPQKSKNFEKFIHQNDRFKQIYSDEFVAFYFLKEEYKQPHLSAPSLTFQKINPTQYRLSFEALSQNETLSFLEAFDNNWKLYLQPYTQRPCSILQEYTRQDELQSDIVYQVKECSPEYQFYPFKGLSYLLKTPLFDQSHTLYNNFANSWVIDPSFIQENYNSNYYQKNSDGSISFELILTFQPQSYFYLGSLFSAVTLSGGVLYCFIFLQRKNKK